MGFGGQLFYLIAFTLAKLKKLVFIPTNKGIWLPRQKTTEIIYASKGILDHCATAAIIMEINGKAKYIWNHKN